MSEITEPHVYITSLIQRNWNIFKTQNVYFPQDFSVFFFFFNVLTCIAEEWHVEYMFSIHLTKVGTSGVSTSSPRKGQAEEFHEEKMFCSMKVEHTQLL